MDELIDTLKERIMNGISGYPPEEQVFIITELTDKLLAERNGLLIMEYSPLNEE